MQTYYFKLNKDTNFSYMVSVNTDYISTNCIKLKDEYQYFEISAGEGWEYYCFFLHKEDINKSQSTTNHKSCFAYSMNKEAVNDWGSSFVYYMPAGYGDNRVDNRNQFLNTTYTRLGLFMSKNRIGYYANAGTPISYLDVPNGVFGDSDFFYMKIAFRNIRNQGTIENIYLNEASWQYKNTVESYGYQLHELDILDEEAFKIY